MIGFVWIFCEADFDEEIKEGERESIGYFIVRILYSFMWGCIVAVITFLLYWGFAILILIIILLVILLSPIIILCMVIASPIICVLISKRLVESIKIKREEKKNKIIARRDNYGDV